MVITLKPKIIKEAPVRLSTRTFHELRIHLNPLLDDIQVASAKNEKEAAKAYAMSYNKAKSHIEKRVALLEPKEVYDAWWGLELKTPKNGQADDIVMSVMSSWDIAAAKYMRGNNDEGDAKREAFIERLKEFDHAIETNGDRPVKKDE